MWRRRVFVGDGLLCSTNVVPLQHVGINFIPQTHATLHILHTLHIFRSTPHTSALATTRTPNPTRRLALPSPLSDYHGHHRVDIIAGQRRQPDRSTQDRSTQDRNGRHGHPGPSHGRGDVARAGSRCRTFTFEPRPPTFADTRRGPVPVAYARGEKRATPGFLLAAGGGASEDWRLVRLVTGV